MAEADLGLAVGASGSRTVGEALPVVYRLAVVYLLLPVGVWLLGWFEWWFGIPAVALVCAGLWRMLSGSWRLPMGLAAVALSLFALICGTLTAFGVFDAGSFDSPAHRGVLFALARSEWPAYLTDYLSDEPPLLRYYLGHYIVPGLAGKWLGTGAMNWAVPLWTWGGIALVVGLCAQGLPTLRAMLLAAAVFMFFSGMDLLEYVLRDGMPDAARRLMAHFGVDSLRFMNSPTSPQWVAHHAYDIGGPAPTPAPASPLFLEYLPNVYLLAINPQHFIGGGLTTLLMLRLCRAPRFLAASGIVVAACLFWSSLLCVGLLPLIVAMLLKNGIRPFLGWRNLLVAPALAALLALYFASGDVDFPNGWLWELYVSRFQLATDVAIFYLAEFLVLAFVLWWLHPRLAREPFFVAAVAVLLAAPWFWYGGPRLNEFLRVAIPSLFVLGCYAAHAVAMRLPEAASRAHGLAGRVADFGGRRWLAADVSARAVFALLVAVLGVGAVTTFFEFAKVDWRRVVPIGRLSPVPTTDFDPVVVAQRSARDVPPALSALLRESADKDGAKGDPLIRSDYDVYLDGNWLVYAKRGCAGRAETRRRFRLRVYPVAGEAAGPKRLFGATVLDFFLAHRFAMNVNFHDAPYEAHGGCVVRAPLPDHGIVRIHTGQHEADGTVLWEAGYDFETSRQFSMPDFYLEEYQAVVAGAPAARSDFDVYLGDGRLAVFRAPCTGNDTKARFLVHLYAREPGDLPADRQQYGFENLDFDFSGKGVAWDGKCLATIQLPDYAIHRAAVGQFVRAEGGYRDLWRVDFQTSTSGGDGGGAG